MTKYLAIIPARGGSKRVPGKNLKPLCGKPLLVHTVEDARRSKRLTDVIVSTDSEEIAAVARKSGAEVPFFRPENLSGDLATVESGLIWCVQELQRLGRTYDAVVLLHATCPIREPGRIDRAIEQFEAERGDSLMAVTGMVPFLWKQTKEGQVQAFYDWQNRPRTNDIPKEDHFYFEMGSMYLTKTSLLLQSGNRLGGKILLHEVTPFEGLDINSPEDFELVEHVMTTRLKRGAVK